MIRRAISPRLATRTRRNGGVTARPPAARAPVRPGRLCAKTPAAGLLPRPAHSGMFPCFLRGFVSRLSASISSAAIRRGRVSRRQDHVVDVAAGCRDVRVVEPRLVLGDEPPPLGDRVVGRRDLVLEDDVDRALGAHHRDLRRRPGEVHVAPDVLGAHDVVGAAVRLAGDDGDLRDRRLAVGVQELRAVLDDPAVLLVHARQEPGHVDEGDERDVEGVAGPHEPGRLDRRLDVERAREDRRLLGHDPDAPTAEAGEADEDVGGPAGLDLEEVAVVDDARDDVVHVVRLRRVVGHDVVERCVAPVDGILRRQRRRIAEVVLGQEREQAPNVVQGGRPRRAPRGARRRTSSCGSSAPPRYSESTSSWVTVFTTFGPVTNM